MNCDIIQDLLILYDDGACSEATRTAVEEHLATCEACRSRRMPAPPMPEPKREAKAIKRSFRKVRRRWITSLLAVLMIGPMILIGILAKNERNKNGLCFSNLDEVWTCRQFLQRIADGAYEEAMELMDFSQDYADIQEALNWKVEDYLTDWQSVTLNGETCWATPWFAQQYLSGSGDWFYMIYNDLNPVLVPEAAFHAAVPEAAEGRFVDGHTIYTLPESELTYHLLETQWGNYLVGPSTWTFICNLDELTSADLCLTFALVPDAIFQDSQAELLERAKGDYEWNQEYYGALVGVSEEEFDALMEADGVQRLRDLFSHGCSITDFKFGTAYQIAGEWRIQYYVTFRDPNGNSFWMDIDLAVNERGLSLATCSYIENAPWTDLLTDTLFMGYKPQ